MKNKIFLFWTVVIVLIALMASTVPIASAVPISADLGCHKETLNIKAQGKRLLNLSKICEIAHTEYWKVEFDIDCDSKSDLKHIKLTMLIEQDKKSTPELKWEILSLKFQGDDICFTGWKGKGYSEDNKFYYEIHGSGRGSYSGDGNCRNALVEGKLLIVDHDNEPTPWAAINLQTTMTIKEIKKEIICPIDGSLYVWTPIGSKSENFIWICLEKGHNWIRTYPEEYYQGWRQAYLTPEYVRDYAILYLHKIQSKGLPDPIKVEWTGGRETPEHLVGSETYVYKGKGLVITIKYPVVLPKNTKYTITIQIQETIIWRGELFQREFTSI